MLSFQITGHYFKWVHISMRLKWLIYIYLYKCIHKYTKCNFIITYELMHKQLVVLPFSNKQYMKQCTPLDQISSVAEGLSLVKMRESCPTWKSTAFYML